MALPNSLLHQIQSLQRPIAEWFSVDQLRESDRHLDLYMGLNEKQQEGERNNENVPREVQDTLERKAASALDRTVRSNEQAVWDLYAELLYTPSVEDDQQLEHEFQQYLDQIVNQLRSAIASASGYKPHPWYNQASQLLRTAESLRAEIPTYIRLRGELLRLESLGRNRFIVKDVGFQQVRFESFFSQNFAVLQNPFDPKKHTRIDKHLLWRATRLITYVVFQDVEEFRLKGLKEKLPSAFFRYLDSSRESPGSLASIAEQLCGLLEPFLKKVAYLFYQDQQHTTGSPLWHQSLGPLLSGLGLIVADLKRTDTGYWLEQLPEDAILRETYSGRHIGSHEAHQRVLYESERLAHCALASLLVCAIRILTSKKETAQVIDEQGEADQLRDLFPLIDDLHRWNSPIREGRVPTRLAKLIEVSDRAKVIWPVCSGDFRAELESEYLCIRDQIEEADREDYLQSSLEDMAPDYS